jgi:hypothetical protein
MKGVLRLFLVAVLVVVWVGAVVYPDPRPFADSIARLKDPPLDAMAASEIAAGLPDDYGAIESYAESHVVYKTAWALYDLPWYFPTVTEVIEDGAGDCQARAVLVASILEAKGMPYTMRYSFDHVWVDWPGKGVTDLEDPATSFVADEGEGWLAGLPGKIPLWTILKVRIAYHWTPMPLVQKLLILLGAALIVGHGERRFFGRLRRWALREPPAWSMAPRARGLNNRLG